MTYGISSFKETLIIINNAGNPVTCNDEDYCVLYTTKIFFRWKIYSPYPNLEGIKDALSYKFRRLTIGQNCCVVRTNKVPGPRGHRDAFYY